ncbi:hypothetical protein LINPERHAP2_LOCUS39878 [Linum perenne]
MKNNTSSYKLGDQYIKWCRGERCVDRLSNFLDSVLHHILDLDLTKL